MDSSARRCSVTAPVVTLGRRVGRTQAMLESAMVEGDRAGLPGSVVIVCSDQRRTSELTDRVVSLGGGTGGDAPVTVTWAGAPLKGARP